MRSPGITASETQIGRRLCAKLGWLGHTATLSKRRHNMAARQLASHVLALDAGRFRHRAMHWGCRRLQLFAKITSVKNSEHCRQPSAPLSRTRVSSLCVLCRLQLRKNGIYIVVALCAVDINWLARSGVDFARFCQIGVSNSVQQIGLPLCV